MFCVNTNQVFQLWLRKGTLVTIYLTTNDTVKVMSFIVTISITFYRIFNSVDDTL